MERIERAETGLETEGGHERQKLTEKHTQSDKHRKRQRFRDGDLPVIIKHHPNVFNSSIPFFFFNLDFQAQGVFGFLALPHGM